MIMGTVTVGKENTFQRDDSSQDLGKQMSSLSKIMEGHGSWYIFKKTCNLETQPEMILVLQWPEVTVEKKEK